MITGDIETQTDLVGLVGDAVADGIAAHEAAADPHPQYLTSAEGAAAYAPISHTHAASDVTSGTFPIARLPVAASGVTSSTEVVRADDSRLSDARTPTAHTHPASQISDSTAAGRALLTAADAAAQRSSLGLGSAALSATSDFAPASHVGAGGSAHAVATTSTAGFMSAADKAKLDGIASGATANTGTVTSVGLSLPSIFSVSGSPVTTSGTLTGTLATQSANLVWAGPSTGSPAAPTFRALVSADIPGLDASKITSGTFADGRIAASNVTQHQGALSIGWSQLTGLPAFATRWPTWSEVTDKPTTFTPSAHTHPASQISDLSSYTGFDSRYVNVTGDTMTGALSVEATITGWTRLRATNASGTHSLEMEIDGTNKNLLARGGVGDLYIGHAFGVNDRNVIIYNGSAIRAFWTGTGEYIGYGDVYLTKSVPVIVQRSPSAINAYRLLANISDSADYGYQLERWNGSDWVLCWRWQNFSLFIHGYPHSASGAVGSQAFVQSYGWNNGITRWGWVLEPGAALSLYAYGSGGGVLGQKLQIDQDAMNVRVASDGIRDTGGNVRDVPVVTRNSDHTLTSSDRGRKQIKTGSSAVTYTIAAGLPDGMTVVVRNRNASGNITVARGTGVELYMVGNGTNANRTVAPWGEALLHHEGGNVWSISGTGVS